jgi:pyruvate formate lyase activating enzyme
MQMIHQMCRWLAVHDLAEAPLHFSRFFPRYKMQDTPPTPITTLKAAKRVAEEEGIKYVYLGNV